MSEKKIYEGLTLGQRLLNARSEINAVGQSLVNNQYKAKSDSETVRIIKPVLDKWGILYILEDETDYFTDRYQVVRRNGTQAVERFVDAKYVFAFVNCDDLSDKITISVRGHGVDESDKGAGKAMTYAKKYGLINTFLVYGSDDPDFDNYSNDQTVTRVGYEQEDGTVVPPTNPNSKPTEEDLKVIEERLKVIQDILANKGNKVTLEALKEETACPKVFTTVKILRDYVKFLDQTIENLRK